MLGFSILIVLYVLFYLVLIIGWNGTQKSPLIQAGSKIDCKDLTVVIPFRNELDNLYKLLERIDALKCRPKRFIFVNDHSEDDWKEVFEKAQIDSANIYTLSDQQQGKKAAVYEGVKMADTKYILCWDADVCFEAHYFEDIEQLQTAELIVLPVHFVSKNPIQSMGEIDFYLANFVNQASAYWKRPIMCNGANLLFSRSDYLEVNKLEEHAHILSGDDMFLLRQMIKTNKTVYCAPNKICPIKTQSPSSFIGYLNQRTRWFGKSLHIKDSLLNFWAIIQFIFTVSFFSFFIYWIIEDPKIFAFLFIIKCGIDLLFLSWYFYSIKKSILTFFIPIYGLVFPIYNLFILSSFYFTKQKWKGRKLYT